MLPLIPRQDGEDITIPTDNGGIDKTKEIISALVQNQYFWGVVVVLGFVWLAVWAWNSSKALRYGCIFIAGVAAGNFFPVLNIFQ